MIVHPFYFRRGTPVLSDQEVFFPSVATKGDNSLYLVRNGPSNLPSQFGGPDDAILGIPLINGEIQSPVPLRVSTGLGNFSDCFKVPRSVTAYAQPPQTPAVRTDGNFLFTSWADNDMA